MKQIIRTVAKINSPILLVMAAAFLFSNFISSPCHAQNRNIDGAFAAIVISENDMAPALDGSVAIYKKPAKLKPTAQPSRIISLNTVLDFQPVSASQLSSAVAAGKIQTESEDGIRIAVEKKNGSGKVQRIEAIVSVDDLDPMEDVAVKRQGISVSLGEEHPVVHVLSTSVGLSVQPPTIALSGNGSSVEFSIDDLAGVNNQIIQIYPRDPALLHWDASTRILTATANHIRTEVYVARSGQLVVVPVVTGSPAALTGKAATAHHGLALPPELVHLPEAELSGGSKHAMFAAQEEDSPASASPKIGLGIHATKEEAAREVQDSAEQEVKLRRVAVADSRRSLRLKLTDDRTSSASDHAYPVAGSQVYVAGAEFSSTSDAHGVVSLSDLPGGSSLVVASNDPGGTYVRTAALINVPIGSRGDGLVLRDLIIPRALAFDAWTRMAGVVQDPSFGSICLEFNGAAVSGIRAQLDVKGQGPFYFNADGVIDHTAAATFAGGRACWFNVDLGPVNVAAWQAGRQVMANEFAVLSGRHTHERVRVLPDPQGMHVQFAREPAAHEQLSGDSALQRYIVEDEQQAVLVASTQKLFKTGDNIQGVGFHTATSGGSEVVYLDSPDFEPAIYRIGGDQKGFRQISVLPAVPRGFLQDMAVFAQESQEFTAGAVLVEYSPRQNQSPDKIQFRLVNEYGHSVVEPWIFSDLPLSKGMFFNVPPGIYSLIIEGNNGGWIGAETVSVYGEALSVVQSGSYLAARITADAHH